MRVRGKWFTTEAQTNSRGSFREFGHFHGWKLIGKKIFRWLELVPNLGERSPLLKLITGVIYIIGGNFFVLEFRIFRIDSFGKICNLITFPFSHTRNRLNFSSLEIG